MKITITTSATVTRLVPNGSKVINHCDGWVTWMQPVTKNVWEVIAMTESEFSRAGLTPAGVQLTSDDIEKLYKIIH